MERRKYRRIGFRAPVFIEHGGRVTFGEVENLSNMGAYVRTSGVFNADEEVQASFYFLEGTAALSVTLPGTVVRTTDRGIGIFSPCLDIYTMLHFEHLLAFHKGDPKKLTSKFYEYFATKVQPAL